MAFKFKEGSGHPNGDCTYEWDGNEWILIGHQNVNTASGFTCPGVVTPTRTVPAGVSEGEQKTVAAEED